MWGCGWDLYWEQCWEHGGSSVAEQSLHRATACPAPHPTPPARRLGGGAQSGEGAQPGQLTKGTFHTIGHHAQPVKLREDEGSGGHSE